MAANLARTGRVIINGWGEGSASSERTSVTAPSSMDGSSRAGVESCGSLAESPCPASWHATPPRYTVLAWCGLTTVPFSELRL
eukprot:5515871-Prymnesium_polylepis.1